MTAVEAEVTETAPGAEVAVRQPARTTLPAKIQYAKLLADSGLLPSVYRKQPGNVLYAVEYGEMLGLPPMAAITGVHVIEGKPTASAALISALVRRAGHKLRVGYDEPKLTGWAEIVRSDDPGFTYRSEWDLERAVTAELCTIKDGKPFAVDSKGRSLPWRKFFPSMAKARAITEVARDACEEVLFGLHYTPEELGAEVDEDGSVLGGFIEGASFAETDAAWMAATLRVIPQIGLEASRNLWREVREKARAGELTAADEKQVLDTLKARMEALAATTTPEPEVVDAEVVEDAAVLDPEDPWAAKVEELTCDEDGEAALAEATRLLTGGEMDLERFQRVEAAIVARFPQLGGEEAKAA